ncbi:hypothetical protein HH308_12455 [Gordonia sp. TBRC 11910]|uniref:Uncharacterized protein n=1 Tax=Gordonia asplenii TaxID=2725283 RepID=A0A848KSU3_9ACTN|nr:hypothetical protein [Gordonia asplenii]
MSPKRGERVPPPRRPKGWELRFATSDAVKGWEELCRNAAAQTWDAWTILSERPVTPMNRARQHQLKGQLGTRSVQGVSMPQWQYEVTSSGRIWYCVDEENMVVWLTMASTSHPKATE